MVQYCLSVLRSQYKWIIGLLLVVCTAYAAFIPGNLNVQSNIIVGGTVDGRDLTVDGAKLDAIDQGLATTDLVSFAKLTVDSLSLDGSTLGSTGGLIIDVDPNVLIIRDGSEGISGECWISNNTTGVGNWDTCPSAVIDSSASNFRIESMILDQNGVTHSIVTENGAWIDSVTRNGVGDTTLNLTSGLFSAAIICTAISGSGNNICFNFTAGTSTTKVVKQTVCSSGALTEQVNVEIICHGAK